jgi:hypothetical protein
MSKVAVRGIHDAIKEETSKNTVCDRYFILSY